MDYRTAICCRRREDNKYLGLMEQKISVKRIPNYPIDSNCFVITKLGEDSCILVDPALGDGFELKSRLSEFGVMPEYIILTHEHFDHISSVEFLRKEYGCQVIASAKCSDNITDPKKNLSLFTDQRGFACSPADIIVDEEEYVWEWRNLTVNFYHTPGHSEGGLCFSIGDNLFTGDTLMGLYKPVTKLPGGNKVELDKSVKKLIVRFDDGTNIFPGHGDGCRLSELISHNQI
jgi:hydroxyacylglutathione hydrolase